MPYVRPHAYTSGTPIEATEVAENHSYARIWLNSGLDQADYDASGGAIAWTHIRPGSYAAVLPDHELASGSISHSFTDASPDRWIVTGQSVKQLGQDTALWYPIESRRVYTRSHELVMVSAWWNVQPRTNAVDSSDTGGADRIRLMVDGELVTYLICNAYAPDTGSSNAGSTITRRRTGSISHLIEGLSAGWHTVELVVDSNHDLTLIYSRSLTLEVIGL